MEKLSGRFLCWDDALIEQNNNIDIVMHKPVKKNIAVLCDSAFEGVHNGYSCVVKVDDTYRFYYRAQGTNGVFLCVAESKDGINFTKPVINKYSVNGSKENNVVYYRNANGFDNFSVFYDENPDCPADEKFKALSETHETEPCYKLTYFASADGYNFTQKYDIDVPGTFDSFNTALWDNERKCYFLYYRSFRHDDGSNHVFGEQPYGTRVIRVATSKDFVNFEDHGCINFGDTENYQLYTNQITKYFRDKKTFIGFPMRYCDRVEVQENFEDMPIYDFRKDLIAKAGRSGTAITDSIIMTSSDGFNFNRTDEAFLTPGPENNTNWFYGGCATTHGLVQTKADEEGAADEISFYTGENYRVKKVNFRRYTVRLDGFFSWCAKFSGGNVLTKPFIADCDELRINFATSALGSVGVCVCDEDGNTIDGYEARLLFGDSVDRKVCFEKPISDLMGKYIKLKFTLKDAHIYSFIGI